MNDTALDRLLSALVTASNELDDFTTDLDTSTHVGHKAFREAIEAAKAIDSVLKTATVWHERTYRDEDSYDRWAK